MAKAYWISVYRSINDPAEVAEYARLAGPALIAAGGRFVARGMPAVVFWVGPKKRAVFFGFDSVAQAQSAHDSPAYQEALRALGDGAVRDIRILEAA
jgi:uncharacterized protein (DUF1330 family)